MMQDYSELHTPTGALGSLPAHKQDWQQYRLSENQVKAFHRDGFLAGVQVLDDHQVEVLCTELAGLMEPAHPSHELFHEYHSNESSNPDTILFHALGAWRTGPAFHDVLWSPAFLVAASQLLDGAVRFWHDQLFCKPAHHGGVVAWHQDYSYWTRTKPMAHLTCWMAGDTPDTAYVHRRRATVRLAGCGSRTPDSLSSDRNCPGRFGSCGAWWQWYVTGRSKRHVPAPEINTRTTLAGFFTRRQRDLNPCYRRERVPS